MVDTCIVDVETCLDHHVADQGLQVLGAQEVQLQVLGAATDGLHDLMGLGGGQHEDHVVGGLLQRLEQGVLRSGGQHVDFVQEVNLGPTRGPQGHLGQ